STVARSRERPPTRWAIPIARLRKPAHQCQASRTLPHLRRSRRGRQSCLSGRMGIFSRFFKGGQDGEPPDDENTTDAAPLVVDEEVPPLAEAPPVAPRTAPAGSEPTPLPKIEPNMWLWPGSQGRTPEPLPPAEPPAADLEATKVDVVK